MALLEDARTYSRMHAHTDGLPENITPPAPSIGWAEA